MATLKQQHPKINVDLLQQVRDAIAAHPEHFSMCLFYTDVDCGTTACIGGWTVWMSLPAKKRAAAMRMPDNSDGSTQQKAADLLGLGASQSYYLFYGRWAPHHGGNLDAITHAETLAYLDKLLAGDDPDFPDY